MLLGLAIGDVPASLQQKLGNVVFFSYKKYKLFSSNQVRPERACVVGCVATIATTHCIGGTFGRCSQLSLPTLEFATETF